MVPVKNGLKISDLNMDPTVELQLKEKVQKKGGGDHPALHSTTKAVNNHPANPALQILNPSHLGFKFQKLIFLGVSEAVWNQTITDTVNTKTMLQVNVSSYF
jgi:hypothetical protein